MKLTAAAHRMKEDAPSSPSNLQYSACLGWCNYWLSRAEKPPIADLSSDLKGAVLASILEALSGKKLISVRSSSAPNDNLHNLEICFAFLRHESVSLLNLIGPRDIHEGKLKVIQALIWTLAMVYGILRPWEREVGGKSEETQPVAPRLSLGVARKMVVERIIHFLAQDGARTMVVKKKRKKKKKDKKRDAKSDRAKHKSHSKSNSFDRTNVPHDSIEPDSIESYIKDGSLFVRLVNKSRPELLKNDTPKTTETAAADLALSDVFAILQDELSIPSFLSGRDYQAYQTQAKPLLIYLAICLHALQPPVPAESAPSEGSIFPALQGVEKACEDVTATSLSSLSLHRSGPTSVRAAGDRQESNSPHPARPFSRNLSDTRLNRLACGSTLGSHEIERASLKEAHEQLSMRMRQLIMAEPIASKKARKKRSRKTHSNGEADDKSRRRANQQRDDSQGVSEVVSSSTDTIPNVSSDILSSEHDAISQKKKKKSAAKCSPRNSESPSVVESQEAPMPETAAASSNGSSSQDSSLRSSLVKSELLNNNTAEERKKKRKDTKKGTSRKGSKLILSSRSKDDVRSDSTEDQEKAKIELNKDSTPASLSPEGSDKSSAKEAVPNSDAIATEETKKLDAQEDTDDKTAAHISALSIQGATETRTDHQEEKKDVTGTSSSKKKKDKDKKNKGERKRKGSKLGRLIARQRRKDTGSSNSKDGTLALAEVELRKAHTVEGLMNLVPPSTVPPASSTSTVDKVEEHAQVIRVRLETADGYMGRFSLVEVAERISKIISIAESTLASHRRPTVTASDEAEPESSRSSVIPHAAEKQGRSSSEDTILLSSTLQELEAVKQKIDALTSDPSLAPASAATSSFSTTLLGLIKTLLSELRRTGREERSSSMADNSTLPRKRSVGGGVILAVPLPEPKYLDDSTEMAAPAHLQGSKGVLGARKTSTPRCDNKSGLKQELKKLAVPPLATIPANGGGGRGKAAAASAASAATPATAPVATSAEPRGGFMLGRLRSFTNSYIGDDPKGEKTDIRTPQLTDRPNEQTKASRESRSKISFGRSASAQNTDTNGTAMSAGNGGADKDRERFWRSVRNAHGGRKGTSGSEEPLVVTLCKRNIRNSLLLLQGDVLTGAAVELLNKELGPARADLSEQALLLADLESIGAVLDALFLGFSSVERLKNPSMADLNEFSKMIYNLTCLLKAVERSFRRSLLDYNLQLIDTAENNISRDKVVERNAHNLMTWKTVMRDSATLFEETILVLDSIRQKDVVKTMRLNSWQNSREKLAVQVHTLKVEIKNGLPLSAAEEALAAAGPLSARGESRSATEDIMLMVEREIEGLVDSQDGSGYGEVPEPDTSDEESQDVMEAGGGEPSPHQWANGSLPSHSSRMMEAVPCPPSSKGESEMNEIFDFLHRKLTDSGIRGSSSEIDVGPVSSSSSSPRTQTMNVDEHHSQDTIPSVDVTELPPPPDDESTYEHQPIDEDDDENENQEIKDIFVNLQLKLAIEGIKVTSCEQAVVEELTKDDAAGDGEDIHRVTHLSPLPSPPSIQPLSAQETITGRLPNSPSRRTTIGSVQMYHARLLPSRAQEIAQARRNTRSGRLDMCATCSVSIQDDHPRMLALGQVFHRSCFKCVGCGSELEREFYTRSTNSTQPYCCDCAQASPRT